VELLRIGEITMSTMLKDKAEETQRRVHLILEDTAHHLTSQDLLRITQIAEQAQAAVHISYGSWQVLIGVPEIHHQDISEALRDIGYECDLFAGELELSTFALRKGEKWDATLL
jgi:hypothetical protein